MAPHMLVNNAMTAAWAAETHLHKCSLSLLNVHRCNAAQAWPYRSCHPDSLLQCS